MTAEEIKAALYRRHPGGINGSMPGAWTVLEEWRGIDLLAVSAWQSAQRFARIGYEVKVSRSDLRRELLRPWKRAGAVSWCNEFYLALPAGLLTPEELAFEEPEWGTDDFNRERCPGYGRARPSRTQRFGDRNAYRCWQGRMPCSRRRVYVVEVPVPYVGHGYGGAHWTAITCPACGGTGHVAPSRVEREAPGCWVPRDVGLVLVTKRGSRIERPSPRRKDVAPVGGRELGQLVRWISMRPDPRHRARAARPLTPLESAL